MGNVSVIWQGLAGALAVKDQQVFALKNADLDTGAADDDGQQIFVS